MFRVMKTNEFDRSVYYKADCSCGSDEHCITIEFEHDEEIPSMIFLNFYKDIAWCCHWGSPNFFKRCWLKTKAVFRIIFTGYIELNESFILQGEKQIEDLIYAMQEGLERVKSIE